jgi:hypothetical protein
MDAGAAEESRHTSGDLRERHDWLGVFPRRMGEPLQGGESLGIVEIEHGWMRLQNVEIESRNRIEEVLGGLTAPCKMRTSCQFLTDRLGCLTHQTLSSFLCACSFCRVRLWKIFLLEQARTKDQDSCLKGTSSLVQTDENDQAE